MMLHSYGYNLLTMFSPTALETNGKEWCYTHYVSTGAFKFDSYERDVVLKMVRNDNYWRGAQYPYLDGIEIIFVADSTIAAYQDAGRRRRYLLRSAAERSYRPDEYRLRRYSRSAGSSRTSSRIPSRLIPSSRK